jgi:hypothetical protein
MWMRRRGYQSECTAVHDALESISSVEQPESAIALGSLLAQLPQDAQEHIRHCGDCRDFAGEMVEVRGIFRGEATGAQPGPYFMARVMAAIADREAEQEKSAQTWAAVPRLAYRLSVLASLSLLLAASWLYQQPRHDTVAGVNTAHSGEGLVDGSGTAIQDDFLLNLADR